MLHPDRFSQKDQAQEWSLAHEMFQELNNSYEVLRDPLLRSAYDRTLPSPRFTQDGSVRQPQPEQTPTASSYARPKVNPRPASEALPRWVYSLGFLIVLCLIDIGFRKPKSAAIPAHSDLSKTAPKYVSPTSALPKENSSAPVIDYPEPENGHVFTKKLPGGGRGTLKIVNGCDSHAVIKLVPEFSEKALYVAFVRSTSDHTFSEIPDGRYKLMFVTGHGWDDLDGRFTQRNGASIFEQLLDYTTEERTETDGVYSYPSRISVSLNPVVRGKAHTAKISPQEFEKY